MNQPFGGSGQNSLKAILNTKKTIFSTHVYNPTREIPTIFLYQPRPPHPAERSTSFSGGAFPLSPLKGIPPQLVLNPRIAIVKHRGEENKENQLNSQN